MPSAYPEIDLTTTPVESVETKIKYVATPEEHEANVQANVARGLPSLEKGDLKNDPIAVVCFGPSLKHTRRDIRHFKYILTCSGAHKYLIDHGIVPTWHMEGDPRKHKAYFLKRPHRRVQYLLAASCHPATFDAVKGYDVRIWHSLKSARDLLTQHVYPVGHWVLTGGTNIGLRAMVMARVLGFRDIHLFGMDCSAEDKMHASDHPNEVPEEKYRTIRVAGKDYKTTTLFLAYAKGFFHEALQLPDVHVTLHGEGLLQALARVRTEDPDQLQEWLDKKDNIVETTVAVRQMSEEEVSHATFPA